MCKDRPEKYTVGEVSRHRAKQALWALSGSTWHISGRASRLVWLKWNEGEIRSILRISPLSKGAKDMIRIRGFYS